MLQDSPTARSTEAQSAFSRTVVRVSPDVCRATPAYVRLVAARTTYAVIWAHSGEERIRAGRIELHPDGFALHGRSQESEIREQIDADDIAAVQRLPHTQRLGRLPALQIERRIGPAIVVASIAGIGVLREITEALAGCLS